MRGWIQSISFQENVLIFIDFVKIKLLFWVQTNWKKVLIEKKKELIAFNSLRFKNVKPKFTS